MKGRFTMKKLLAMLTVGGVLALTTGCPPAPSTEKPPVKVIPPDTNKHGDNKRRRWVYCRGKLGVVQRGFDEEWRRAVCTSSALQSARLFFRGAG